jgi:hypothetical protein
VGSCHDYTANAGSGEPAGRDGIAVERCVHPRPPLNLPDLRQVRRQILPME